MVSGFVGPLPESTPAKLRSLVATFIDFPFDGRQLRQKCSSFRCFHGDDDDVVPLAAGRAVAELVGAPLTVVPGGRHLNTEAGVFEFPALLQELEKIR